MVLLVCPPIFDEHGYSYAVVREFARHVAARGIAVMRFDYFGTGDSAGSSEQFSVSSAVADITFLFSWLRTRFPESRIASLGIRLGSRFLLDALAAGRHEGGDAAAGAPPLLWDPVLDVNAYLYAGLRATLGGAMVVYEAQVASRDDIIRETLQQGYCERRGYRLNKIDGFPLSAALLQEAGFGATSPQTWSYTDPVTALVTARSASLAEKQRAPLSSLLTQLEFQVVEDVPYWNLQPIYRQTRDSLFSATEAWLDRFNR